MKADFSLPTLYVFFIFKLIKADFDFSICSPTEKAAPPPIPPLALSYSTTVEWKLIHKNSTITVNEYIDGIDRLSSITLIEEGTSSKFIFDENSAQYFAIKRDNFQSNRHKCITKRYDKVLLSETTGGSLWRQTTKQLYDTFIRAPLVYNGTDFIRSTYVDVWTSCFFVFQSEMTVDMKFYFAVDGWPMPNAPPDARVPIRLELRGNQNGTLFHIVGDYFNFVPSPQQDVSVLQPPPGTYCPGRVNLKQMLAPPKTLATVIERIDVDGKTVTFQEIWFDSQRRFVRIDKKSADGSDADPEQYIHDFQSGIRYQIDPYLQTCTSVIITLGDDFVKSPAPDGRVTLQSTLDFFYMTNASVQYVGKRKTRSIECDVWVGYNYNNLVNRNQTIEWYFMESGWIEAAGLSITPGSLVRYDVWVGDVSNPIVHHIHKIDPSQPMLSVFDISNCYSPISRYHFVIKFAVSGKGSVTDVSQSYLADDLHINLASLSTINPLRIAQVSTEHFNGREFYFTGIIVDKPDLNNDKIFPPPPTPIDLDGAFGFIRGVISTPWMHNVTSSTGEEVLFTGIGITTINYRTEIRTTTTLPTTSVSYNVPTLPKTGPTTSIPVPPTPGPLTSSLKTTSTPSSTAKQAMTSAPCVCNMTCPATKCPTTPTPRSVTSAPCVCNKTCPTATPPPRKCPTPVRTTPPPRVTAAPCVCKTTCPTTSPATTAPPQRCPTIIQTAAPSSKGSSSSTVSNLPNNESPQKSSKSSGVSSGGAAGIAIAMLIVGIFIGIGVIMLYQRKFPTSISHRPFNNPVYDDGY